MTKKSQDVRVISTTRIWGITVGILAVCIPLSAVTRSGALLPLAAIGGATAGTIAIWRADDKKSKAASLQPQQLKLLEQRIANLETIVSNEEFDLQKKIKQLESSDRNHHSIS
ncbi:hypothetical protein NIES2109_29410 [Nostoc sp. HK-01]|uniref:Uncharacterized protein n=1 Tax=Nostoc cycadae WK-1 TaxID=1861711 RepID=A0A2H6LMP7_9NOSO|nr:hypothetical protein [Nostoc cycadae]BBD60146.1 hypothetical protein NIES2109_29410 [Nostoc sp. HK-01]GBE94490.1 hypothetical protein NCWK1_4266 [Nostoc cycadae WK-1]